MNRRKQSEKADGRDWLSAAVFFGFILVVAAFLPVGDGRTTQSEGAAQLAEPRIESVRSGIDFVSPGAPVPQAEITASGPDKGGYPVEMWRTRVGTEPVAIDSVASDVIVSRIGEELVLLDPVTGRLLLREGVPISTLPATRGSATLASSQKRFALTPVSGGFVELRSRGLGNHCQSWRRELPCEGEAELLWAGELVVVGLSDQARMDPAEPIIFDRLAVADAATGDLVNRFGVYPGCLSVALVDDALIVGMFNGFVVSLRLGEEDPLTNHGRQIVLGSTH